MSTRVRLTDAEKFPRHYNRGDNYPKPSADWADVRGQFIKIGAPQKPSSLWTCNTDVVWPVLEWRGVMLDTPRFVCRHQIHAGD